MPEGEDPEGASGPPPHPLDRVWFHPSELSAYMAATGPRRRARSWLVGGLAAAAGAVLTLGILFMTGALDSSSTVRSPFVAGTAVPVAPDPPNISELATTVGQSLVTVAVRDPAGNLVQIATGIVYAKDRVLTMARPLGAVLAQVASGNLVVVTPGSKAAAAQVLGSDPETDLAVLRIDDADVPSPRWGAPGGVRVGDDVVAVARGNTGQSWVSSGVVSVLNQMITVPSGWSYAGLIGTDTAAHSTEAGGALLDADGAVIGILSASDDHLAVPIDVARGVADQLSSSGKAVHGWLGVWGAAVLDRAGGGVRVENVAGFSPALKAGIVPGDIITAVGDDAVSDMGDLVAAVRRRLPHDPVDVTIIRDGHRITKNVQLADGSKISPTGPTGG
jgi:S1-C subfamily serine protease